MRRILSLCAAFLLALSAAGTATAADVPMLLNYQGRLTDPAGAPKDGTFSMTFAVYDAETLGNALPSGTPWSETQNVTVAAGVFNVLLGSVAALPTTLFEGGPSDASGPMRFLHVVVDGEELAPRRRVTSAAYSIHRGGGGTPLGALPGFIYGGAVTNSTASPAAGLDVSPYHVRDLADTGEVRMSTAITKLVTATWVAGSGNGGLDTGVVGASPCWIYVYAIGQTTNAASADVLFTKTLGSPTLPSGWTSKRLLGARRWNGTAFRTFMTRGNGPSRTLFYTDSLTALVNGGIAFSWTDVNTAAEIPAGISRIAHLSAKIVGNANGTYSTLYTRQKGSSQDADYSTTRVSIDIGYTLTRNGGGSFIQDTDGNGYFQYQYFNGGGAYVYCRGFDEEL